MFQSPTYGKVDLIGLKKIVSSFMAQDKNAGYEIIVGSDSQKLRKGAYDFVSALIVHRIGSGGYEVKIKPDSYGASKVADRHT